MIPRIACLVADKSSLLTLIEKVIEDSLGSPSCHIRCFSQAME